jgi:TrmH family RNA methyltransferase
MSDHAGRRRIDSSRNPRFRTALQLRDRQGRMQQRRFLIDGIREIRTAINHSIPIVETYVCAELAQAAGAQELLRECAAHQLPQFDMPPSLLLRLAFGDRKDGIVAVAGNPVPVSESLDLGDSPLVIVLEQLEKPGNIGAVIRTADAVGARCVVLADGNSDLYNPNTIRASIGTIFCVPVLQMKSRQAIHWLREKGLQVHVARVDAATSCFEVDLRGPAAVVLGSESQGVSAAWSTGELSAFHVPMQGHADSLNVSVTAAVVLYEAYRQRSAHRP